jgi:hypothetical protein
MSGETEQHVSGWTTDTLKELHDREITADRTLNKVLFGGVALVVALGWHELQRRLTTLNHAHENQVQTLAATVTSDKYESDKTALGTRLDNLEKRSLTAETKGQAAAEEAARLSGARGESSATGFSIGAAKRQTTALYIAMGSLGVSLIVVAISLLR